MQGEVGEVGGEGVRGPRGRATFLLALDAGQATTAAVRPSNMASKRQSHREKDFMDSEFENPLGASPSADNVDSDSNGFGESKRDAVPCRT